MEITNKKFNLNSKLTLILAITFIALVVLAILNETIWSMEPNSPAVVAVEDSSENNEVVVNDYEEDAGNEEIVEDEIDVELIRNPLFVPYWEENNDFVGWISVDNTYINYPIYQSHPRHIAYLDEYWEFYLRRNRHGVYDGLGEIFIWPTEIEFGQLDLTYLLGHNFRDQRRQFSQVESFVNSGFNPSDHRIRISTFYEDSAYEILWVVMVRGFTDPNTGRFSVRFINPVTLEISDTIFWYHEVYMWQSEAQLETFINSMNQYSFHGSVENASGPFVALQTCESRRNSPIRIVAVAARVDD